MVSHYEQNVLYLTDTKIQLLTTGVSLCGPLAFFFFLQLTFSLKALLGDDFEREKHKFYSKRDFLHIISQDMYISDCTSGGHVLNRSIYTDPEEI